MQDFSKFSIVFKLQPLQYRIFCPLFNMGSAAIGEPIHCVRYAKVGIDYTRRSTWASLGGGACPPPLFERWGTEYHLSPHFFNISIDTSLATSPDTCTMQYKCRLERIMSKTKLERIIRSQNIRISNSPRGNSIFPLGD